MENTQRYQIGEVGNSFIVSDTVENQTYQVLQWHSPVGKEIVKAQAERVVEHLNAKAFIEQLLASCPYRYEVVDRIAFGELYIRLSVNPDKTSIDDDITVRVTLSGRFLSERPRPNITVNTWIGDTAQAIALVGLINFVVDLIGKYKLTDFS